jgi:glc operon protein GlcG
MLGSCLAVPGHAAAQSQQPALTLERATRIADAAQAEATRNKWNVVIAVVDDGGYLVHLRRLDGTQLGSVAVAEEKAKSAVLFRRPTKAFADAVASGRTAVLRLPGAIPIEGGIPLVAGGQVVGAIGGKWRYCGAGRPGRSGRSQGPDYTLGSLTVHFVSKPPRTL